MRKPTILVSLIALVVATGVAMAGPRKPPNPQTWQWSFSSARGRLGLTAIQISPELRARLGGPNDKGVLIDQVRPDSPAARAGVRVGDLVTEIDGEPATTANEMVQALADRKRGDTVGVVVSRAGQRVQLSATLDDDPAPAFDWGMMNKLQGGTSWPDFDELQRRINELEQRMHKLERT